MGQRHQVFVFVNNPIIKEIERVEKELSNKPDKIKEWKKAQKELRKYIKQLGKDEKTVLTFHHQWLYGASAPANACQVLFFSKCSNEYSNPFHKEYNDLRHSGTSPIQDLIDFVTNLMCIQTNEIAEKVGTVGLTRFTYLNDDDFEIREDFRRGDNNDGITIIDTTTNKYCFLSFDHTEGEYYLPLYVPMSAVEYLHSYYPVEREKLCNYTIEKRCDNDEEQIQAKLKENKDLSDFVEEKFKDFEVMTLEEVKAMFPKVYETLPVEKIGQIPERD